MVEAGILDPAKVTRSALQNATSVASTLLTTESAVANIKEDAPAGPAAGAAWRHDVSKRAGRGRKMLHQRCSIECRK